MYDEPVCVLFFLHYRVDSYSKMWYNYKYNQLNMKFIRINYSFFCISEVQIWDLPSLRKY